MDYKKIIKNRSLRVKILEKMRFIPDKTMLRLQYRIKFKRKLNLKNPQRWTEKIQWYKLNYHDPDMARCVDKYEVREYLVERGFEGLLNKCYGVYSNPSEIDFNSLPASFVAKDTLGGGGNDIIIVKDKVCIDENQIKKEMQRWCNTPLVPSGGREWPYYKGKPHRIYIEEYLDAPAGMTEYKFFCFNGEVAFLYAISERTLGCGGKFRILTPDFRDTGVIRVGDEPGDFVPEKPKCFEEMLDVAKELSHPFPHVRVDLFDYNGIIRFGELTFYNASGYMKYEPDAFDFRIGGMFILPKE